MVDPKIIKEEVVVVDSFEIDDFGNLIFYDKSENKHKISFKREHLFGLIESDRAVNLFYAKYMDKVYIADVKPVGAPTSPKEAKAVEKVIPKYTTDSDKTRSIERQVALKEAVTLCVGGVIDKKDIHAWADKFSEWLDEKL